MARKGSDFATGKPVDLDKPEESVRQEYERVLVESYGYPKGELDIEVRVPRGSGHFPDKADIVVYGDERGRDPARHILGIVETKRPTRKDGLTQLKSYMTATSAVWGVWTNGDNIAYLSRDGAQILDDHLNNIPARGQSIEDVGRIEKGDLRPFNRSALKSAFRRILRTLYANTNIGRREKLGSEMTKIIFAKLEDERTYADRPPEFRAQAGEKPKEVARRVKALFRDVRDELKDDGVFSAHDTITLDDRSIAWVVGQLERGSLLNTDSDVVGDAFEVFSESKFIGEKGEFFTPRGVVRIAVKLADPAPRDKVCDPACGSGGFLIHAMKHVWDKMADDPEWRDARDMQDRRRQMAARSFFGIDKETDLVKIAKAHMAIAGDGRSNIVHENALHKAEDFEGDAARHFVEDGDFKSFNMVLTNPPFGTKTKVLAVDAADFILGSKWRRRGRDWEPKPGTPVERDPYVLFVERCLDMLKREGTLAIVLPETVFHAPTLGYLRRFLLGGNNLRAVVDLPHNTFRPHCNAKTCLVVLTKDGRQQDQVVMATPQQMGHDHTGRPLYRPETDDPWDDLAVVLDELDDSDDPGNRHVFSVAWGKINPDILVPRFYRGLSNPPAMPDGRRGVRLGDMVDDGTIGAWDGHGSPESQVKGEGDIPYIRVSDIVNWELYRNPVAGIPEDVYERMIGDGPKPEAGDIIFVRRGSYRIGTVAMASPRDRRVLLTRELLTLRVLNRQNPYGLTPFYLLAMLSSGSVQDQIGNLVLYDTTLPNIGDRWRHLVIPVHEDAAEVERIGKEVEMSIREKWSAQDRIEALRSRLGGVVT